MSGSKAVLTIPGEFRGVVFSASISFLPECNSRSGSSNGGIRRKEWNQKIEKVINLIQSFIQNPTSPVKTPQTVTTKVSSKPIQNTALFEENSGQSFRNDEVEKEVKDIGFKGALVTVSEVADGYGGENLPQTYNILKNFNLKDISTCNGSPKLANNQKNRITIEAGDQSRVTKKDVPSHGPRKQKLGGLIFDVEVEILVGFDLRTFEGLHCDLSRGQERRTWNPGITYHQSRRNFLRWTVNPININHLSCLFSSFYSIIDPVRITYLDKYLQAVYPIIRS
ncbi:hypothetical protein Tco_1052124 [Tanacetum coccineum]